MEDHHEYIPLLKSCGFIPTRGPQGPPHSPPMAPMIAADGERSHAMIYIPTHPDDLVHVPAGQAGFFHIVYAREDLLHSPPQEDPNYHWIHEPGRMLPFIGTRRLQRSSCLFLAAPNNTRVPEMYRRISSMLNNKAVTKTRSFFRDIVEPAAFEVWRRHQADVGRSSMQAMPREDEHALPPECPICTRVNPVFKVFVPCGHRVCLQCEKTMDRAGTMTCPMCRRLRLVSTFETPGDLFKMTIGLHKHEYNPSCPPSGWYAEPMSVDSSFPPYASFCSEDEEDIQVIHRELRDRFHWETPLSFLQSMEESYNLEDPLVQYLSHFAESDRRLRMPLESNDLCLLDPPLSGLTLPPHRLYMALIHYCLDMLTLPRPLEFQRNRRHRDERLALNLVMLFLVPTDEYSPRGPERMHNLAAWLRHGQVIQARLRKVLYGCARANASSREMSVAASSSSGVPTPPRDLPGVIENRPIHRTFLYLGVERWVWITQSIEVLLTWIRLAAQAEHLQAPPYAYPLALGGDPSDPTLSGPIERKRPIEDQLSLEYYPLRHRGFEAADMAVPEGEGDHDCPSFLSFMSSTPMCQTL
ncbi:hypothetical protein DFQ26_003800 [Actinomortierella ambigua]|nr:hypothetical protein DFQ26_003800 [Actinomortierella ambigua]